MSYQTKTIGARLGPEQVARLERIAKQRDVNKSDLVREAINQYLTEVQA